MRTRTRLATAGTALIVGMLPVAAMAQDTTNDAGELDRTFVPQPSGERAPAGAAPETAPDTAPDSSTGAEDSLPNTGGGLALAGGLAMAGAATLRGRRN